MFHGITCNKWTCSTQTCFTMHSDSAWLIFNQIKELIDDINWWWCTIREDQIMMFDSLLFEPICIIGVIIKSNDHRNTKFFKHWYVISWSKDTILKIIKKFTPYLSTVLSYGELKATNFPGIIQLRSPFYTFS